MGNASRATPLARRALWQERLSSTQALSGQQHFFDKLTLYNSDIVMCYHYTVVVW